jgi:hypothetical protein
MLKACVCNTGEQFDGLVTPGNDDAIYRPHVHCCMVLRWISVCTMDVGIFHPHLQSLTAIFPILQSQPYGSRVSSPGSHHSR